MKWVKKLKASAEVVPSNACKIPPAFLVKPGPLPSITFEPTNEKWNYASYEGGDHHSLFPPEDLPTIIHGQISVSHAVQALKDAGVVIAGIDLKPGEGSAKGMTLQLIAPDASEDIVIELINAWYED